jgi:hypothetical protein
MYVYIMVCFVFFLENTHNTHSNKTTTTMIMISFNNNNNKTVRHTVWIDDELKLNIIYHHVSSIHQSSTRYETENGF